jgi:hypothetical protein
MGRAVAAESGVEVMLPVCRWWRRSPVLRLGFRFVGVGCSGGGGKTTVRFPTIEMVGRGGSPQAV